MIRVYKNTIAKPVEYMQWQLHSNGLVLDFCKAA